MNLKQIAEIAGCGEKTVRRTAKNIWPNRSFRGGANLDDRESMSLMKELPKRNMVSGQNTGQMTVQDIAIIVKETIIAMIPIIKQSIQPVEQKQIEAPQIATRDELRRIVNKAAHDSGDYAGTWNRLYSEIYYRLHINAKERAQNNGTQAIDILEAEGFIPESVAIAREIFQ